LSFYPPFPITPGQGQTLLPGALTGIDEIRSLEFSPRKPERESLMIVAAFVNAAIRGESSSLWMWISQKLFKHFGRHSVNVLHPLRMYALFINPLRVL
jgi:hypothetical protein